MNKTGQISKPRIMRKEINQLKYLRYFWNCSEKNVQIWNDLFFITFLVTAGNLENNISVELMF